jgi:broad specificity phosphatase PhoE
LAEPDLHSTSSCIAVLRHGNYGQPDGVPSAHLPYPLNETGIAQAQSGARELLAFCKAHDYQLSSELDVSELLRAWQTGHEIQQVLENLTQDQFTLKSYAALAERSVGSVANLSIKEIEHLLDIDPRYQKPDPGWKSNSWYKLPFLGAESLMESGVRVSSHLQHCANALAEHDKNHSQKKLKVVVGHGASIRHAALSLGLLVSDDIPNYSMYHARPIIFNRDSNGQWQHWSGEWKIRATKDQVSD